VRRVLTTLLLATLALTVFAQGSSLASRKITQDQDKEVLNDQERAIKVTIDTVSPMLGGPTSQYKVGDEIPITIKLTNTANQATYTCLSGDLYQDLPKLTKNGNELPYTSWQAYSLRSAKQNQTCQREDLPDEQLLRPNEPAIVDSLIVADDLKDPTGALAWYERLTPGTYELSIQRRFGCCDGPMVESNKISFEVLP